MSDPKFTEELGERIIGAVMVGVPPKHACRANGVTYRTWFRWQGRAGKGEQPYADFFDKVRNAESTNINSLVVSIALKARDDANIAIKWLGRRYPGEFGERVTVQLQDMQQLWMTTLERVLDDTTVKTRLAAGEDSSLVITAFCSELARLDGEDEAPGDSSPDTDPVH